ncbi:hypothetical protein [Mesorhizobium sp. M0977]
MAALAVGRTITWLKGHAGDPHNEEVDALANAAAVRALQLSQREKEKA